MRVADFHTYFVAGSETWGFSVWAHNSCTLTAYEDGGGHHVFGKKAFEGVKGYDMDKALSISTAELKRLGLRHLESGGITQTQRALFTELAGSGRPNTLAEHARIARESLIAGGMSRTDAVDVVQRAMAQLKGWGLTAPARIPWN